MDKSVPLEKIDSANAPKKEVSIIESIRDMVKEGESEEKIIQNLKDLGVEPEKAKRLLLLGQADTFALLRNEISKIVNTDVEKSIPLLEKQVAEKSAKTKIELKEAFDSEFAKSFEKLKGSLIQENKDFRDGIAQDIRKTLEITESFRENLDALNLKTSQINADIEEAKLSGVGSRNKWISLALILGGIVFLLAAFYLIFFKFSGAPAIDGMIFTIITALIGITMLFVSTIV